MKITSLLIMKFCFVLLMISCNKNNPISPVAEEDSTNENKWESRADMPTSRAYFCSAVVGGKIYLIGGIIDLSNNSDAVEVYDPEKDNWSIKNKMPEAIVGLAAAVVDGKIYTFGGRKGNIFSGTSLNHTYLYDPDVDSWIRKADMPTSRAFLTASVIDGKIYTIGGSSEGFEGLATVEMYDPATNTWTIKASLLGIRALPTANVFNGKIYVIGGGTAEGNNAGISFSDFDLYDPESNSWESKPDIAQARMGHGSGVINNKLFICGGFSSNTVLSDLIEYNFDVGQWTTRTSMPSARRCFTSCVFNNKFFIFGGITGSSTLKSVVAYTPTSK